MVNPESQEDQKKTVGRPQKYSQEFRRRALQRMQSCDNITALAQEIGVNRKFLYQWREDALGLKPDPPPGEIGKRTRADGEGKRNAELEGLVARQALEIDFFRGALQPIEELRRKREQTSGAASTSKSSK